MKKAICLLLGLAAIGSLFAQDNVVKRIPKVGHDSEQQNYATMDQGFWMSAEALGAMSCHLEGSNMGLAEVDVTAGYRISQYLKLGVGVGARYYINQDGHRRSSIKWGMPVFATVRGNFISSNYRTVVPYWGLEAGASIRDGMMVRPTIGVRIGEVRNAFTIGISYMGQELAILDKNGEKAEKYTNFVCIRLGYEF